MLPVEELMVSMPDGVQLFTRVWKPDDGIFCSGGTSPVANGMQRFLYRVDTFLSGSHVAAMAIQKAK